MTYIKIGKTLYSAVINGRVSDRDWNNREIFTAEETMVILSLGETTYKRWVNDGWLSETQMMGSNKRYVQKKDIIDFLKIYNVKPVFDKSYKLTDIGSILPITELI